jgi:hypothetical protein
LFQDDSFAKNHVELIRYGEVEDPREMDRVSFHALKPGYSMSKNRSVEVGPPLSESSNKKRSLDHESTENTNGRELILSSDELQLVV